MSFTDGKSFIVDKPTFDAHHRYHKRFGCSLCGVQFKVGETARWIFANFKASPAKCGLIGNNTDPRPIRYEIGRE